MSDEFEVKATGHPTEPDRIWTRDHLAPTVYIAEKAVRSLGYRRAEVVNTFGGVRSEPLHVVEALGTHSRKADAGHQPTTDCDTYLGDILRSGLKLDGNPRCFCNKES